MIALTDQDVAEFGELYFRETGCQLPPERVRLVAERLVELVGRLDELRGCPDPLPQSPS